MSQEETRQALRETLCRFMQNLQSCIEHSSTLPTEEQIQNYEKRRGNPNWRKQDEVREDN